MATQPVELSSLFCASRAPFPRRPPPKSIVRSKNRFHAAALEILLDALVERLAVDLERLGDRAHGGVDLRVAVRVADDERRHQEAPLDRLLQEQGPELLRRLTLFVARRVDEVAGPPEHLEVLAQPV